MQRWWAIHNRQKRGEKKRKKERRWSKQKKWWTLYSKPTSLLNLYCLVIFRVVFVGWLAGSKRSKQQQRLWCPFGDVPIYLPIHYRVKVQWWRKEVVVVVVMEVNFQLDSLNKNGSLLCRFFSIRNNQSPNAIQQMQCNGNSVQCQLLWVLDGAGGNPFFPFSQATII